VRADIAPQSRGSDAHLLNRKGVARLMLRRQRTAHPAAGARLDPRAPAGRRGIYGHPGIESDLESSSFSPSRWRRAAFRGATRYRHVAVFRRFAGTAAWVPSSSRSCTKRWRARSAGAARGDSIHAGSGQARHCSPFRALCDGPCSSAPGACCQVSEIDAALEDLEVLLPKRQHPVSVDLADPSRITLSQRSGVRAYAPAWPTRPRSADDTTRSQAFGPRARGNRIQHGPARFSRALPPHEAEAPRFERRTRAMRGSPPRSASCEPAGVVVVGLPGHPAEDAQPDCYRGSS